MQWKTKGDIFEEGKCSLIIFKGYSQPLFLNVVEVVMVNRKLCDVLLGNHHALHGNDQVKFDLIKKNCFMFTSAGSYV